MAIIAGVYGKMFIVVKAGVIRKLNFLDRMAFTAGLDAEGRFAVMTRPA